MLSRATQNLSNVMAGETAPHHTTWLGMSDGVAGGRLITKQLKLK